MKKNLIQAIVGIVIGGVLLYLTLHKTDLESIKESIKQARLNWIFASGVMLVVIFYLRAMRWRVILFNLQETPSRYNVFHALLMGYFVNSFTPKLGELYRCTNLTQNENIPLSKNLGSVVSERIWDFLILFIGLIIILLLEFQRVTSIYLEIYNSLKSLLVENSNLGAFLLITLIVLIALSVWLLKRFGFYHRIKSFVLEMVDGIRKTFKLKNYQLFLLYTVLIWVALVAMNYCFLQALPETAGLSFYFSAVVLFISALGWAMPTPNGIGTTHIIVLNLFLVFGMNEELGAAFGLLSNGLTLVFTVFIGLIAVALRGGYLLKENKMRPSTANN